MYKVLFDSTNTTFDKISNDQSKLSLNKNHNIIIQSYEQTSGVGRGVKKWNSPRGNIYFTINQNKNTSIDIALDLDEAFRPFKPVNSVISPSEVRKFKITENTPNIVTR